jgi:hypothetical protein
MAVLEGVAGSWKEVGDHLGVPDATRHLIDSDDASDEEKLRACVLYWLHRDPLASWRMLTWRLDYSNNSDVKEVVDETRGYAEKLTGQCYATAPIAMSTIPQFPAMLQYLGGPIAMSNAALQ